MRFIESADGADGAVEKRDLGGEGVAEKARNAQGDIDARAAKLCQRNDLIAHDRERRALPDGSGADQREGLGNVIAAGAHIGGAPDAHGDGTGVVAVILEMAFQKQFGGALAEGPGHLGRDGAVVDRIEIAAGGKCIDASARGGTGGTGSDEFAVKAIEQ